MSRKILFTGFGPFGIHHQNPTEICLRHLAEKCKDSNIQVLLLPVDYKTAVSLLQGAIEQRNPDVVLMLGLSMQAPRFRLEQVARNRVSKSNQDVSGFVPSDTKILDSAPDQYETNVDLSSLMGHLKALRFDIEISKDAGDYVCNYLYFQTLHGIVSNQLSTQALFIHTPLSEEIAIQEGLNKNRDITTIEEKSLQELVHALTEYFSGRPESRPKIED